MKLINRALKYIDRAFEVIRDAIVMVWERLVNQRN